MSDDKKYYYIKLKENYFEKDNIKILEAQENGYIYSLIILKLYLKSAKHDGCLMMTDRIPYDPNKLDILAKVLNHDVAHIKDALAHAKELDLITIMSTGEIFMTEIQNFLGHSSSEADRKREYRKKLDDGQMSRQLSDDRPPELERELEKERKKDIDKSKIKHKYGEYKHVLLTDKQYEDLKDKVDDREKWIRIMDESIEEKGNKYNIKNFYLAILKWYGRDNTVDKAEAERNKKFDERQKARLERDKARGIV